MTAGNYNTKNYETDYTKFGGIIYFSDYDTNYTNGNIAQRIISDWNFDKQCRKNIEAREWRISRKEIKNEAEK